MSYLDRRTNEGNGVPADPTYPVDMHEPFPALCEFLCSGTYPGGDQRLRSTLTIMAGDLGGLKMVLNDRDNQRSLWATGSGLDDTLAAMENMLQSSCPPWRNDPGKGKGKRT